MKTAEEFRDQANAEAQATFNSWDASPSARAWRGEVLAVLAAREAQVAKYEAQVKRLVEAGGLLLELPRSGTSSVPLRNIIQHAFGSMEAAIAAVEKEGT